MTVTRSTTRVGSGDADRCHGDWRLEQHRLRRSAATTATATPGRSAGPASTPTPTAARSRRRHFGLCRARRRTSSPSRDYAGGNYSGASATRPSHQRARRQATNPQVARLESSRPTSVASVERSESTSTRPSAFPTHRDQRRRRRRPSATVQVLIQYYPKGTSAPKSFVHTYEDSSRRSRDRRSTSARSAIRPTPASRGATRTTPSRSTSCTTGGCGGVTQRRGWPQAVAGSARSSLTSRQRRPVTLRFVQPQGLPQGGP